MSYLNGVDIVLGDASVANQYVDPATLEQSAEQLIAQSSESDAIAVATDINGEIDQMITQLQGVGGQDALIASGTDIENRAYDLVMNYDPGVGDSSVPGKAAQLQSDFNNWSLQAYPVLRTIPTATAPAPAPTTPPTTSPTPTPVDSGTPSDGGYYGGGGGGGDAGPVDWGDDSSGDTSSDNGGFDDVPGMSSADQGIDWGDDSRDQMPSNGFDDSAMPAGQDQQDPFSSMLPSEDDMPAVDDGSTTSDTTDVDTSDTPDATDSEDDENDMSDNYLVGVDMLIGDNIPSAGATYNNDPATVLAVQTALKAHGFDPGPLDGEYGPKTKKAIEAMQTAVGLEKTGVIDYGVLMALKVTAGTPDSAKSSTSHSAGSWLPAAFGSPPPTPTQQAVPQSWWKTAAWSGAPVNRLQAGVGGLGLAALAVGVVAAVRR